MNGNLRWIGPWALLMITLCSGCLKSDELNLPFRSFEPVEIDDGTKISTPVAEGMDPEVLNSIYKDVYEDDNLWSLRSLLVYKNGKLVAESYLKDTEDLTQQRLIWSCTKQVMGILTGIALENGVIKSLEDPMSTYLEASTSYDDKKDITIRNLITMHSGIDFSNDGTAGQTDKLLRQIPDNSVSFILERPMRAPRGTEYHYNDGDPHLVSALIQETIGKPTDEWASEVLFSKIGMTNYHWVRYRDGVTFGGFGLQTTPRELAKIALLVAQDGVWNGDTLVSQQWIEEMTHPHKLIEATDYGFGYYWWVDTERKIQFTWGHGGQFTFIIPEHDLLVVMTSIPNTQGGYQVDASEALPIVDRIIAASHH